jgi:hypothetical protein
MTMKMSSIVLPETKHRNTGNILEYAIIISDTIMPHIPIETILAELFLLSHMINRL